MIGSFRFFVFILIFSLFGTHAFAQVSIQREHYTTADGMSDNRTTSILKDKDGFMWFSTWVGISRFDGYKFSIFKSSPGDHSPLSSDRIDEMQEDPVGHHFWIKAYDGHIYRFDKYTERFTELSELLKEPALKKLAFTGILAVGNNSVWLRTKSSGILQVRGSASENPRYTRLNTKEKGPQHLPSDRILFLELDRLQNAWIGTSAGLVLLEARKEVYKLRKLPPTLDKRAFRGMTKSGDKVFLASTEGQLIETNSRLSLIKTYAIATSSLNHILFSIKTKRIYCTTSDGRLFAIAANGSVSELMQLQDKSALFSIYEDKRGKLWVESENYGIVRFDPGSRAITYLLPPHHYDFGSWAWNATVFEDINAHVWINIKGLGLMNCKADAQQLNYFEMSSGLHDKELSNNIVRCYYDESGVLWISSGFEGLEKVVLQGSDFKQFLPKPGSPYRSENEVRGIFSDSRGRLWLGTKDGMLYVFKNGKQINNILPDLTPGTAGIYAIYEDRKGTVWLGTKAGGLIQAKPVTSDASQYATLRYFADQKVSGLSGSTAIYCFLEDSKGRLWAGAFGEGLIQITESNGKTIFKTTSNCFKKYPREEYGRIRHLAEDARGNIWIATSAGLLVFNPDRGKPENYDFKIYRKEAGNIHSLGGNDVHYIHRDAQKQMWVLTFSGGLNLAEGNDPLKALTFTNYSTINGLPSDCLLSCAEDRKGNLWIAAQNGISRFSINKRKFQNYGYRDGIHDATFSETSCATLADGSLVFGTTHGYLEFNPATVHSPEIKANLVFTNFQVNSKDVVPGAESPLKAVVNNVDDVVLDYDQNVISIDFAVLDYYSTDKQNYACRLIGFDNEWRNTEGQNRAIYTKLPPGDYVFEVKSLNEELYKNNPERSLKITILPPPWKTWWAYLIYLFIAAFLVLLIRKTLITMFNLRQSIAIEKGMADLKLSFFTQVSHELRTPLTLILNPAEEVLQKESLSKSGRDYMEVVLKNTRRMVRMVNQLLDLRKVQSGKATLSLQTVELVSFTEKIAGHFSETIKQKNLAVKVSSEEGTLLAVLDADKMEIVIYNLLANAIKFSGEGGFIEVDIKLAKDNKFVLEVRDEGQGVNENELQDIFKLYYEGNQVNGKMQKGTGIGLSLSRELVELHGGKIYAENRQPQGLRVIVEMERGAPDDAVEYVDTTADYTALVTLQNEELVTKDEIVDQESLPLIVLAEDNDDLRSFLTAKLKENYRVETASNGEEALEKANSLLPDLVLSDIMMPKMDGIQLLDSLKNNIATSHIPVVLLTAKLSVESQIEGLRYGADYYITKPFEMELLQIAIANLIKQRKKWFKAIQEGEKPEEINQFEAVITEQDQKFLQRLIQIVEEKLEDPEFNIDEVAESIGMSRSAFYKKFKSLTNIAPVEFVRETRLNKAKALFDSGEANVSMVAYSVGFNNPKYFSTCFKSQFNCTPTEYLKRRSDKGNQI